MSGFLLTIKDSSISRIYLCLKLIEAAIQLLLFGETQIVVQNTKTTTVEQKVD